MLWATVGKLVVEEREGRKLAKSFCVGFDCHEYRDFKKDKLKFHFVSF
jgi:hypothetical protein